MSTSVDAVPLERDLADVAGAIAVHVEIQNELLVRAHERALSRHPVTLPIGATAPAFLLSPRPSESYERR